MGWSLSAAEAGRALGCPSGEVAPITAAEAGRIRKSIATTEAKWLKQGL